MAVTRHWEAVVGKTSRIEETDMQPMSPRVRCACVAQSGEDYRDRRHGDPMETIESNVSDSEERQIEGESLLRHLAPVIPGPTEVA